MLGDAEIPEAVGRRVFQKAEANPLFVTELIRSLVEGGHIFWEQGRWQIRDEEIKGVPERVQEVIRKPDIEPWPGNGKDPRLGGGHRAALRL